MENSFLCYAGDESKMGAINIFVFAVAGAIQDTTNNLKAKRDRPVPSFIPRSHAAFIPSKRKVSNKFSAETIKGMSRSSYTQPRVDLVHTSIKLMPLLLFPHSCTRLLRNEVVNTFIMGYILIRVPVHAGCR